MKSFIALSFSESDFNSFVLNVPYSQLFHSLILFDDVLGVGIDDDDDDDDDDDVDVDVDFDFDDFDVDSDDKSNL